MHRAVFVDRDGVLNDVVLRDGRPYPPASVEEMSFLPGAIEAVAALRRAGYRVIVATNQPDVAKGIQRREVVEAMHERVRQTFAVNDIKVCYHVDDDGCACRKPKPGMLLEAAREWGLELRRSFMVGDRWRDIGAGRAAGCATILVTWAYVEREAPAPDLVVRSLAEATQFMLGDPWATAGGVSR